MQVLFLAIHYPKPEHLADLVGAMASLGRTLDRTPGVVAKLVTRVASAFRS